MAQVESELPGLIEKLLDDSTIFRGGKMPALNTYVQQLRVALESAVSAARSATQEAVEKAASAVTSSDHFEKATAEAQATVRRRVQSFKDGIATEKQIATLKGKVSAFHDDVKPALFQILAQKPVQGPSVGSPGECGDPQPEVKIVSFGSLELDSDIQLIETAADIEDFVDAVRRALTAELTNGTKVTP